MKARVTWYLTPQERMDLLRQVRERIFDTIEKSETTDVDKLREILESLFRELIAKHLGTPPLEGPAQTKEVTE